MNQAVLTQNQYGYDDEISLMEILLILKESWKLIAVIFLITVIIAGSVSYFLIPKKYQSHTLFTLEAEGDFGRTFGQVNMVKDVIHSNHFLTGILEKKGLDATQVNVGRLRNAISISATEAKNIRLQIIWPDPREAYELLNLVYDTYQSQVAERINIYNTNRLRVAEENFNRSKEVFEQVNKELADFQKTHNIVFPIPNLAISDQYYLDFKGQLNVSPERIIEYERLGAEHVAARDNYIKSYNILENTRLSIEREQNYLFMTIEPPVFPEHKYSPSVAKNTAIAGVLGLFAGVMFAFFREYIKQYQKRELVESTSHLVDK